MKRWYIVHAYSGYEKQVMRSLKDRIERSELQESFGEVLVPTEEVVEMKDGKKRKSERKFFPGYVRLGIRLKKHQKF
jgi:transcriptional antiterminator NusG